MFRIIPQDAQIVGMHLNRDVTVIFWRDADGVLIKTRTESAAESELGQLVESVEAAFLTELELD